MSKILVLCLNIPETERKAGVQYEFNSNDLVRIKKYKEESFDEVIFSCGEKKIDWNSIWALLKPKGILRLKRSVRSNFMLDAMEMNEFFIPLREVKEWNSFVKIAKLTTEIVSPDTIVNLMEKSQDLNNLFDHGFKNPEVCRIVLTRKDKFARKLGAGVEGTVYHIPEWRSDVVVKVVQNVATFNSKKSNNVLNKPIEGVYSNRKLTEVLSGSLTTQLLSGKREEGYLLHIQRYTGFFSCLAFTYDFYLISELVSGDFSSYLRKVTDLRELKVLLWQIIFSLHSLNKLEFFHQDSSIKNIFYKTLEPNDEFLGHNLFEASTFVYRLDEKEWKLPNVGKIAKIADFGFTTHLVDPMVFGPEAAAEYRIDNQNRGAYDISYFISTLHYYVERHSDFRLDLNPFFIEFYQILGLEARNFTSKELEDIGIEIKGTGRPTKIAEKWDPLVLLNGPFFSDIRL